MKHVLLTLNCLLLICLTPLASANLSNTPWIPPTNGNTRITTSNGTVHEMNYSSNYNFVGTGGATITGSNNSKTIYFNVAASPTNNHQGTYNKTLANNSIVNSGGSRINFINGTNNPVSLVNDPTRDQINITISSTGSGGSGVTSLNALTGALAIACVSGNTTCTSNGLNTITINTAYNIATLNLNEIFSGITTMNNLKLGGQMNINGQTMQSFGHVYTWPNNTGTICLTNQTGSCGPGSSATYDTMQNVGTGEGSIYKGNSTNTNFQFKTLKQGSHITLTNNTNDVTIGTTGLLSSALLSLNGDTTAAQVVASGNTNHITVTNAGANHNIDTAFKINNSTCAGGKAATSFDNKTGQTVCSTFVTSAITSLNGQSGPSVNIVRELGNTTITNSTNQIKVGLGVNAVITNGAAQNMTKLLGFKNNLAMYSDLLLYTNKINTTNYSVYEKDATAGPIITPKATNTQGLFSILPTGTSNLSWLQVFRTSSTGTDRQILILGSDISATGELFLKSFKGSTATQLPINVYMQNTKLQSFDIANTITSYVTHIFSGGITMSGSDITLAGNKINTTNYSVYEKDATAGPIITPKATNTQGLFSILPTGTSNLSWLQVFRTSSTGTDRQILILGSDISATGELFLKSFKGSTATQLPINVYMQNTKLQSFDIANTITSYVQNIWTPISDPVTSFTNAIWKSSTTADVLKYRNNGNTTTYSIISTISAINATTGQLSGNGTGRSSSTQVMDGVYATITPKNTGRITVHVTGDIANSVSGDGCNIGVRQSTSNMGGNNAALAGTILGNNIRFIAAAANQQVPFSRIYDFSGTVNTQQFFDLAFSNITGGTCTITSVNWDIVEH